MAGQATFRATEDDYVRANCLWRNRAKRHRLVLWLGIAAGVLACCDVAARLTGGDTVGGAVLDAAPIALFAMLLVASHALSPIGIRRQVRAMMAQNGALRDDVDVRWNDAAVHFAGSNGTADLRWDRLHGWLHDDASFVFLQSERMMHIVPTRALVRSQIDDLQATATRSGLSRR